MTGFIGILLSLETVSFTGEPTSASETLRTWEKAWQGGGVLLCHLTSDPQLINS